ncbi:MAG: hypothetical protein RL326_510 [Pseudomonadota bacterium]|jgi:ribosomal protein RSM22 (predicted rRNA methylase)
MTPIAELESYIAREILPAAAFAQYRLGDVAHHELHPYVVELRRISQAYVTHNSGSRLSSPIANSRAAEAYALYYSTINAAKILHLAPLLQFERPEISILDVGCGPGTATLSLLHSLEKRLRVTCVESSAPMRELAKRLISAWNINGNLGDVTMRSTAQGNHQTYDLIVAANVLAELDQSESQSTLDHLARSVAPNGYLLLMEPGQQQHTRRLMALRDQVINNHPELTPIFPCPRSGDCPMLRASTTDWCHDDIEWRQPPLSTQLDQLLDFNKHRIKYAAFVFQRGGMSRAGLRILTPPKKTRLGTEALVCADSFYGRTTVRKSARSERNKPFEKAKVFERLLTSEPLLENVSAETVFTKIGSL